MKLNKAAGALLAVVLCNASTLFGAEDKMMSVKPNGCKGPVLCPTFTILDDKGPCCHTYHVEVGLLYQQPGFSGMLSGTSFLGTVEPTAGGPFQNQTITAMKECLPYSLGLNVALGTLLPHDDWLLIARFDWLASNMSITHDNTNEFYMPNPNFNYDVMLNTSWDPNTNYFLSVLYNANIDIYGLDVVLSRGGFISRCCSFEPFMGVKALWYSDEQDIFYSNTTVLTTRSAPSLTITQDNWGAGPMFGFNGEYHLTHGISLFSDSNIGVLYGSSTNVLTSALSPNGTTITAAQVVTNNVPSNACQLYLPVRSIIGVKLSQYCLNDAHFIAVKLGYDARVVLTSTLLASTSSVVGTALADAIPVTTAVSNDIYMTGLYANFEWNF